ncbi:MAG: SDR family NAD(P)-dependent oxidoreductase [Acidimicrobiia bacterium]
MDLGLGGQAVLVTGAGQGIGRHIGLAFAAEGAHVAFHYHSSGAGAEAAAKEAEELGVRALAVGADISDADAARALVEGVEAALGPLDVLVNNAAVGLRQRFLESTPADWRPQLDVTVFGMLAVSHAALTGMAGRGRGVLVGIMGDSGRVGESGLAVTATARAAMVGFTRSMAKEMARFGIRANAVSLGLVETENFDAHAGGTDPERLARLTAAYPLRRLGRPGDVPPVVLLLASPLTSWVTGQVLSVNGGYAMV